MVFILYMLLSVLFYQYLMILVHPAMSCFPFRGSASPVSFLYLQKMKLGETTIFGGLYPVTTWFC